MVPDERCAGDQPVEPPQPLAAQVSPVDVLRNGQGVDAGAIADISTKRAHRIDLLALSLEGAEVFEAMIDVDASRTESISEMPLSPPVLLQGHQPSTLS